MKLHLKVKRHIASNKTLSLFNLVRLPMFLFALTRCSLITLAEWSTYMSLWRKKRVRPGQNNCVQGARLSSPLHTGTRPHTPFIVIYPAPVSWQNQFFNCRKLLGMAFLRKGNVPRKEAFNVFDVLLIYGWISVKQIFNDQCLFTNVSLFCGVQSWALSVFFIFSIIINNFLHFLSSLFDWECAF